MDALPSASSSEADSQYRVPAGLACFAWILLRNPFPLCSHTAISSSSPNAGPGCLCCLLRLSPNLRCELKRKQGSGSPGFLYHNHLFSSIISFFSSPFSSQISIRSLFLPFPPKRKYNLLVQCLWKSGFNFLFNTVWI